MSLFQQALASLAHVFYPRLCLACHQPIIQQQKIVCLHCDLMLSRKVIKPSIENDASLRLRGRFPFMHAFALSTFTEGSLIQQLLHQLKYKKQQAVGIYLGEKLASAVNDSTWWHQIDAIIPVPLHPKKLFLRGFNQSFKIAEGIHNITGNKIATQTLIRVKHTESQTTKNRLERLDNVGDAFHIHQPSTIKGKHILLVDDVLTTGATVESCARTLIKNEAEKISIATIAIAAH